MTTVVPTAPAVEISKKTDLWLALPRQNLAHKIMVSITHTRTHTHTHIYIYTRQKRTYCSFLSHRVLCMPVLNLPCGTRGRFQGVISSCNNISHLLSLLLPFFGAVSCCFSLPNCVVCWWQFGTVIRKVHSFLYLCFFVFFFPCCDQSVPGGLGYLMFPTVQNHRAVII